MEKDVFAPGIQRLFGADRRLLSKRRIALVTHAAAVTADGTSTVEALCRMSGYSVVCLMAPEHGLLGHAGAGEPVSDTIHPYWQIPVFSLYGTQRAPTREMLKDVDLILVDLQDLGVRCYTYLSTLFLVLEAAAQMRVPVVVADRPIPLPKVCDGPLLDPTLRSFVGLVDVPLCYGMTPAETARWIGRETGLDVDLTVLPMRAYKRESTWRQEWPVWVPPSPGIPTRESATTYPATVFAEALPAVDVGRASGLPYQLVGSPDIPGRDLYARLRKEHLRGVRLVQHCYRASNGSGTLVDGLRLVVASPASFRPVRTAVSLCHAFQDLLGKDRLWRGPGARPEFFDRLLGTDRVRLNLLAGRGASAIAREWSAGLRRFRRQRANCLLYASPRF